MESYAEKARTLFLEGYNCSQSVFAAFCDVTGMEKETALRLASSMGGGMGRLREVCGAVSGMFLAAGLLYGYSDPKDREAKTEHYARIQELARRFQEENGSIVCRELLGLTVQKEAPVPEARTAEYYKKRPCADLVACAAGILEQYMEEQRAALQETESSEETKTETFVIRRAVHRDLPALMDIYNDAVLHGTATFDLEPRTLEERTAWFEAHTGKYALLVCEVENRPVGYASLSPYRAKEAYAATAELSVYVAEDCRRRGIGRALIRAVLEEARRMGQLHTIVSVITAGNEASVKLHREFGFTYCGRVEETGRKFGRYLGIDTYQIMVQESRNVTAHLPGADGFCG